MQAKIRSTVAAAMLLVPVAATFVAQPAAAQQQRAAPSIANMSLNSDGGLSPGATLRVQVHATANARSASLALGDSGITVPLKQQGAGNYTGSYVIRRSDRIDPTQLMTARVTFGKRTYSRQFNFPPGFQALAMGNAPQAAAQRRDGPGRDADVRQPRDQRAPQITELFPPNGDRLGERGRAEVSARLDDEGSGIDTSGARLRLNGRDVTDDARIRSDEIRYRADLPPGRYTAEVTARDRAGNQTVKTWTFDVVEGDRGRDHDRGDRGDRDRVGSGPLPLQVTSHSNNAVVDANGNLALHGRTAPFANVRVQVESVANVAGVLGLTQPVADQTVQADRNGNFNVLVQPRGLPIPGTRYDVRLTATSGSETAQERITLVQRQG